MGYRPDRQRRRDRARWLAQHRDRLLLTGVPEEVFSDPLRWDNFLWEAGQDYPSGWHLGMLNGEDARQLHRFVQETCGDNDFRGLLRRLEDRFGIAS